MQNIDFYSGNNMRQAGNQFNTADPEYFNNVAEFHNRHEEKYRKKANRMLSFIIALCIISFTTGLAVGIKFTSGSEREMVDPGTRKAMSDISKKVTGMVKKAGAEHTVSTAQMFPRNTYPYIIKIGSEFQKQDAEKIATRLSTDGYRIILSQKDSGYRMYAGPFKSVSDAKKSLKKILQYSENGLFSNATVLKR